MDIKNIKAVYFVGIGGIGMSALARYFKAVSYTHLDHGGWCRGGSGPDETARNGGGCLSVE